MGKGLAPVAKVAGLETADVALETGDAEKALTAGGVSLLTAGALKGVQVGAKGVAKGAGHLKQSIIDEGNVGKLLEKTTGVVMGSSAFQPGAMGILHRGFRVGINTVARMMGKDPNKKLMQRLNQEAKKQTRKQEEQAIKDAAIDNIGSGKVALEGAGKLPSEALTSKSLLKRIKATKESPSTPDAIDPSVVNTKFSGPRFINEVEVPTPSLKVSGPVDLRKRMRADMKKSERAAAKAAKAEKKIADSVITPPTPTPVTKYTVTQAAIPVINEHLQYVAKDHKLKMQTSEKYRKAFNAKMKKEAEK
jgi:hypothetical protein